VRYQVSQCRTHRSATCDNVACWCHNQHCIKRNTCLHKLKFSLAGVTCLSRPQWYHNFFNGSSLRSDSLLCASCAVQSSASKTLPAPHSVESRVSLTSPGSSNMHCMPVQTNAGVVSARRLQCTPCHAGLSRHTLGATEHKAGKKVRVKLRISIMPTCVAVDMRECACHLQWARKRCARACQHCVGSSRVCRHQSSRRRIAAMPVP
jgi:hypothetical protein